MARCLDLLMWGPIFGPLALEEWIATHLRDAELHLGFFVPE
jgi:hypothetical protein